VAGALNTGHGQAAVATGQQPREGLEQQLNNCQRRHFTAMGGVGAGSHGSASGTACSTLCTIADSLAQPSTHCAPAVPELPLHTSSRKCPALLLHKLLPRAAASPVGKPVPLVPSLAIRKVASAPINVSHGSHVARLQPLTGLLLAAGAAGNSATSIQSPTAQSARNGYLPHTAPRPPVRWPLAPIQMGLVGPRLGGHQPVPRARE